MNSGADCVASIDGLVEEIPTLKDTCLAYIRKHARKLDYMLSHFFKGESSLLLDTKLLVEVLDVSSNYITVDLVRHLESLLPTLVMEAEYDEVWQKFVKKRYSVREIVSPFPIVVAEVSRHVETLRSAASSVLDKQSALDELYHVPFSDELAKQTGVALTVNGIRKDSSRQEASLTAAAGQLTTKWKKMYKTQKSLASSSAADGTGAGTGGPKPITGNAGMDIVHILTWRQLFDYYDQKELSMIEKASKKFSAVASAERDKRKTTMSAASDELSKHMQDKLRRVIASTSKGHGCRTKPSASSTVFSGSRSSSLSNAVMHSVTSTRGHSALDLLRARNMQSTKHTKVVTTSSGGVMMIPRGMLDRNKR